MSRVIYLASKKPLARVQTQAPSSPNESGRLADRRRLAHDLKNCMSVLLLGLATLDADGDHWILPAPSRNVFEGVVLEMNGIVEELIREDANGRPGTGHRASPPRSAGN